ncbi:Crp/Fnr family transcriptional regulator [Roseomonas sp. BN140053]|uniref:Crp/Fnr family transcriptional regulator n=1 Tax=Roseomonas sp. BN140053 TaxID=3391898 RepID=UPI0039ECC81B
MQPWLTPVKLAQRQVLHGPRQPIDPVHFPKRGWISMIAVLEDVVSTIGCEGLVGIHMVLGGEGDDLKALVQSAGTAQCICAGALRNLMANDAALRDLLLRFALVHLGQVARTAAYNGHHSTEQRLAHWLQMEQDRA